MKAEREITLTITLDDADSEVLEIAAGALDKDPDTLLAETLGVPLQQHIKLLIADLRESTRGANPLVRAAFQGKALAAEALKRK